MGLKPRDILIALCLYPREHPSCLCQDSFQSTHQAARWTRVIGFFHKFESSSRDKSEQGLCREHVLGDGFEMCQALLKQHYLEFLFHAVSQAQCWQDKEAALFGLR